MQSNPVLGTTDQKTGTALNPAIPNIDRVIQPQDLKRIFEFDMDSDVEIPGLNGSDYFELTSSELSTVKAELKKVLDDLNKERAINSMEPYTLITFLYSGIRFVYVPSSEKDSEGEIYVGSDNMNLYRANSKTGELDYFNLVQPDIDVAFIPDIISREDSFPVLNSLLTMMQGPSLATIFGGLLQKGDRYYQSRESSARDAKTKILEREMKEKKEKENAEKRQITIERIKGLAEPYNSIDIPVSDDEINQFTELDENLSNIESQGFEQNFLEFQMDWKSIVPEMRENEIPKTLPLFRISSKYRVLMSEFYAIAYNRYLKFCSMQTPPQTPSDKVIFQNNGKIYIFMLDKNKSRQVYFVDTRALKVDPFTIQGTSKRGFEDKQVDEDVKRLTERMPVIVNGNSSYPIPGSNRNLGGVYQDIDDKINREIDKFCDDIQAGKINYVNGIEIEQVTKRFAA
jgi:hypothetical protein